MNELVKGLSQNDVVTYPHAFFKWVYANPCPSLVGIRRIPAYHVDYTTAREDPAGGGLFIAFSHSS